MPCAGAAQGGIPIAPRRYTAALLIDYIMMGSANHHNQQAPAAESLAAGITAAGPATQTAGDGRGIFPVSSKNQRTTGSMFLACISVIGA